MTDVLDITDTARWASLRLRPFEERFGVVVARWVSSSEEVLWLAPATEFPLTAAKVTAWKRPGGQAFLLADADDPSPLGYAELNPMQSDDKHFWLGHVVLRPDQRGRGVGLQFVQRLVAFAFDRLAAHRISLIVFPENVSAVECYTRAGFTSVGYEHHRFNERSPKRRLLRMEIDRCAR